MAKKYRVAMGRDLQLQLSNHEKTLVYKKGGVIFAFNFHPTNSYDGYWITVPEKGDYQVILSTDDYCFGGEGRIYHQRYTARLQENGKFGLQIYLPSRTAAILKKVK